VGLLASQWAETPMVFLEGMLFMCSFIAIETAGYGLMANLASGEQNDTAETATRFF
jgi:hypothetical protein